MEKSSVNDLTNYISPNLREHLKKISQEIYDKAEEIRITLNKPAMICHRDGFDYIYRKNEPYICDEKTISETLMLITENSLYAINDKISNGFITLKGGYRAGICGSAVMEGEKIVTIKNISSINIRIKREIIGAADKIINYVAEEEKINNTLIISPPQCGKTTLLRDIARELGRNRRISIVDERSEIAAAYKGVPQNEVGLRTTVLDACPKHIGIPLVIRSMSPEAIITDEIGDEKDYRAINFAAASGVKIITSAHGVDIDDLKNKNHLRKILNFFDVFITLSNRNRTGEITSVIRRKDVDF